MAANNRAKPAEVYVSYSRVDKDLVSPVVKIMRAIGSTVFQDIDSIPYGVDWRTVNEGAIEDASIFLLFWCHHSAQSEEVAKEWALAITTTETVIPILLDQTVLPEDLSRYNAMDLRETKLAHATGWYSQLRRILSYAASAAVRLVASSLFKPRLPPGTIGFVGPQRSSFPELGTPFTPTEAEIARIAQNIMVFASEQYDAPRSPHATDIPQPN